MPMLLLSDAAAARSCGSWLDLQRLGLRDAPLAGSSSRCCW